jgi:hypothetical protein
MNDIHTSPITQKTLVKELRLLKSFVIGLAGKDAEGNYRSEFIQKIHKLVNEQPAHTFKNSKTFLRSIEKHSS